MTQREKISTFLGQGIIHECLISFFQPAKEGKVEKKKAPAKKGGAKKGGAGKKKGGKKAAPKKATA